MSQVQDDYDRKSIEKFTPVLGSEREINEALIYLSENLAVYIPQDEDINTIRGEILCSFIIDTTGSITKAWIGRGIVPWLNNAIVEALREMPAWSPKVDRKGKPIEVRHDIYFCFNGQQDPTDRTSEKIAQSRNDFQQKKREELAAKNSEWDKTLQSRLKLPNPIRSNDHQLLPLSTENPLNPLRKPLTGITISTKSSAIEK